MRHLYGYRHFNISVKTYPWVWKANVSKTAKDTKRISILLGGFWGGTRAFFLRNRQIWHVMSIFNGYIWYLNTFSITFLKLTPGLGESSSNLSRYRSYKFRAHSFHYLVKTLSYLFGSKPFTLKNRPPKHQTPWGFIHNFMFGAWLWTTDHLT